MKKYEIEIVETYRKTIEIEANSAEEAEILWLDHDKGKEVYRKTIDYDCEINEVPTKE